MTGKGRKNGIFLKWVILTLFTLLLVSCSEVSTEEKEDPEPMPGQFKVFCLNTASDSLHWENVSLNSSDLNGKLRELCEYLKAVPKNSTHISAIPENVSILSFSNGADGQLIVSFSEEYNTMGSISEVLCRACVVKTLCQLEEIDYVEFDIKDEPLKLKDIPIGLMSEEDFVDYSGNGTDRDQSVKVITYLTDEKGRELQESVLKVIIDGTKTMEETVLFELIAGPLETQKSLRPTVNPDTKVNKVRSYDGVCYVDFDENFLTKPQGVSDEVVVYSVVNTLCELPGITKVKITVNGSERKSFGKVPINEFMALRPELIQIEKAGE